MRTKKELPESITIISIGYYISAGISILTGIIWFIAGIIWNGILTFIKDISTKGAIYKSVEFHGDGANGLSIDSRMTISNMIVEAGAKFGVFLPDEKMLSWLKNRTDKKFRLIYPDENAAYEKEFNYNLSKIIPVVAKPSSPDNVVPITEVLGQEIDQAFLGSCTNGRMEDLRIAARILAKNKVNRDVKLIITPASTEIYLKALKEGLIELFIKAGAIVTHSTCGACIGGHLGVLGPNEICISSTNRNFIGRMGDSTSKIYLASPASVAASAIEGRITDPRDYV